MQKSSTKINLNPSPKPIKTTPKFTANEPKTNSTGELSSKATSPTLIEFQSKNAQLPEWRLQLKNAVQKRKGTSVESLETVSAISSDSTAATAKSYPTSGGNALKIEYYEEVQPPAIDNKKLANALKRIEKSREKFYVSEFEQEIPVEVPEAEKPVKDFPFTIASRNDNPTPTATEDSKSSVNFPPKPKLVQPRNIGLVSDLYNTSELDPHFVTAKISSSFEKRAVETKKVVAEKEAVKTEVKSELEKAEITVEPASADGIAVDDFAPFSLRFNAGLFDLIIGTFASLILLSPFMLLGGNWFTMTGFIAFLATCAIVLFIYMTTTVGLFGKTFGMHLFSLEMVDYSNDEYPNFHQAAVSSSVYLLSIAFAGVGFITYFFDPDKRAVHDLVSGTLVVKEI